MTVTFRYCPLCAGNLAAMDDAGISRLRCMACGWIHYRNPTVGVAVILLRRANLLLGKRRNHRWCIPCGHVEWHESVREAAVRELEEETGLKVELGEVFAVLSNFHDPDQHTIGIWYRGREVGGQLRPGGDLLDAAFFPLEELPELSFPTDRQVIAQLERRTV